ncbi:translesion DNA synthesis-associated protein ImuA [Luteimonas aestuarii]|uniref:Translesion DNA synthesis-associated protein ImuA n=1 Tax=Luteimonas aestuarii TaxID=453837 RepID=A0A4V3AMU6_9GAMM|nr:translesion DNA synthesis-associated protein ImuA [Luteimonas aestuarii]TDK26202.1 translesion DNA synthesis-associated protein ImuA [Luteimonas aestuarii]
MGQVVALREMLDARTVWRGPATPASVSRQPTGHVALDDALPLGGWPEHALTEILVPADGVGEVDLLLPTLRRLTQVGKLVVLVAPPYIPYAPALEERGLALDHVHVIEADAAKALWAFEQVLRSGACAAVIGWPRKIDHHGLRRLQVAADTGQALGFAVRDRRHADQASPAALRLEIGGRRTVTVRKCRGGVAPSQSFALPVFH